MCETIETLHGPMTLEDAQKEFNVGPIKQRFGVWCVTDYGIECLATDYYISKEQLSKSFWPDHMQAKRWVNAGEFMACYRAALKYHGLADLAVA